jgi:hypothetical protein
MRFFVGFLSPIKQIPGVYLDYTITASFQILSNSSYLLTLYSLDAEKRVVAYHMENEIREISLFSLKGNTF